MKKTLQLIPTLLLATAITACTADYDEPEQPTTRQDETPADSIGVTSPDTPEKDYTVISTVPVSDDVKAFLDEALPFSYDKPAYFKSYEDLDEDQALRIINQWVVYSVFNSKEEMQEQYTGETGLPDIDFDKYTLVIGASHMERDDMLKAIEIHSFSEENELTAIIELYHYGRIEFYPFRFWAIFPKLQGTINRVNYFRKDRNGKESY